MVYDAANPGLELLKPFRTLRNVHVTGLDAVRAYENFGKGLSTPPIHYSKGNADLRLEVGEYQRQFAFFRSQDDEQGLFWAALLYAISDGKLEGMTRDDQGFYSGVAAHLKSQIEHYLGTLVISMSA